MFAVTLNSIDKITREKLSSSLKIFTLKDLSWIREVEEILKVIITAILALNIFGLHMKDKVGKEQW